LKDVRFRLDRVTDARLAGIELAGLQSYEDLSGMDVARLGAALADGRLPLSFTLYVEAENPASNDVTARLVRMDWTLLLEEKETVSGRVDREISLPPGEPTDVPVPIELDLVSFFDENLRQLVGLAAALGGEGPPQRIKLRAQPTVRTPLGRMKYPQPLTVVHEEVGGPRS
jgi:hypothetical protein